MKMASQYGEKKTVEGERWCMLEKSKKRNQETRGWGCLVWKMILPLSFEGRAQWHSENQGHFAMNRVLVRLSHYCYVIVYQ